MYHKIAFCLIGWLTVTAFPLRLSAWQAPLTLPQQTYQFHKIAQAEGLSSYNVKKIVQDAYGYTWIATQDGLNRYDGRNISIYTHLAEAGRRLANNDIWDLAEDTVHRRLWVLSYGGLNVIDLSNGQVLPSLPTPSRLQHRFPKGYFKRLRLCGHRLWIGSHNGLAVYDVDRDNFADIDPLPSPPIQPGRPTDDDDIDLIWQDERQRVWVFVANYGIVLYSASGHILEKYPLAELGIHGGPDFYRFRSLAKLSPGRLALVTNTGFFELTYHGALRLTPFPLPGNGGLLDNRTLYSCAADSEGTVWVAAQNALYRINLLRGQVIHIGDADVNPENWFSAIYSIYFDAYRHIWLGTQKGAAFSTTTITPFTAYFQSADFRVSINHANYAFPERDTVLDVCAEDGFYHVNPVSHVIRRLAEGQFMYTTRLQDGEVLVSGEKQLYVARGSQLIPAESVYPELAPIRKEPIVSLIYCGDSLAIMGSQIAHGIFCWYPRKHLLRVINETSRPLHLANGTVNALYSDRRGRVWILSNAFYSLYDPTRGRIDTFHVDDPYTRRPATFYFDITEALGCYWLAVYGTGVLGLDSGLHLRHVFSMPQGMANSGVYKVFAWRDSLLFVTSNNGLSRIRLADSAVVNYFQKDGLHGNGFEQWVGYTDGHYIYTGGERGVSRISPLLIPMDPSPPSLRIGNVRLQTPSATYALGDLSKNTLTIPENVVRTTLTLFTFNYTDQDRTQLSYRIPELKTPWISLSDDRTIDLLGFSPGSYTLLVRAMNPNGSNAQRQLTLFIEWLPKWYQTLWFKLVAGGIVLLLFYAFYRYRIHQIRQQQLIRQNISSDLHDDIGSTLNTIRIFAHLARNGPQADSWLAQIETSLAEATVAVRDMIWVLDDTQDTVFQLLERIRQFAIPVTAAHGIHLEVTADGPPQNLNKDEKRNLLLITKEAVNNSIKYAGCTRISIQVVTSSRALSLHIEDDGVGFDSLQTTEGNGLRNIARRARRMRYTATIESTPGVGTHILLTRI